MSTGQSGPWCPTLIRRAIRELPTGAGTIVVDTDAGEGYVKAMGNPGGEHILACEWVGTQLARWFGLSSLDYSIIQVTDVPRLEFAKGGFAKPGPAFITRSEPGEPWSPSERQLRRLVNPEDISRLVVFDTWTLNCDRHAPKRVRKPNPDNVFLSTKAPAGRLLLKAMDHTHCFTCGRPLSPRVADIGNTKNATIYGLFPEFRRFLRREVVQDAVDRLRQVRPEVVQSIVESIPPEWDVNRASRSALCSLVLGRADYVADTIMQRICPQGRFGFANEREDLP